MSTIPTTSAAHLIIRAVSAADTINFDCEHLDNGTYRLSVTDADTSQIVTDSYIIAGAYGWATAALTHTAARTTPAEARIARAVITQRWATVADLIRTTDCDAGMGIWDAIGQIAAEMDA